MDGNKDEAQRCVKIAEAALASGDKQRALKFIRIARRLDHTLAVADLLAACETQGSSASTCSTTEKRVTNGSLKEPIARQFSSALSGGGDQSYSAEKVKMVREIKRQKDYYKILGVEKSCSVEEIRKAYRKLSLKVHPDKNKAPGSEEAFKMVSKAFKCLSDKESRMHYDQIGLVEEFECNQQHNVRRRRTGHDMFDENFDPDEIFRSFFFGSQDMFQTLYVHRTREVPTHERQNVNGGGLSVLALLQILPVLVLLLVACLPFSEPDYSLQKTYSYQMPKVTEKFGVEFYVKSSDFDKQFPPGNPSRVSLENRVVSEYRKILGRYCYMEMQRRQWARNYPTPYCDKLQNLGAA